MFRDFTFVEDIADGVLKVLNKKPKINKNFNHFKPITSNSSALPNFNIGNGKKIHLMKFINILEKN